MNSRGLTTLSGADRAAPSIEEEKGVFIYGGVCFPLVGGALCAATDSSWF